MKLQGTMQIKNNQLLIGGVEVARLRSEYGTPLYIVDQAHFKNKAKLFIDNFRSKRFQTHIYYASKAFSNLYVLGLVRELGLHLDVVSGGELYTAIESGFDPQKISMHGNNKLPEELSMALDHKIGTIII